MSRLVLQRLVLPATVETAGLYWRHGKAGCVPRASAAIEPGDHLDLDTYFNSFDEQIWQRHTTAGAVTVELELDGPARIELWRHSRAAPPALLAEALGTGGTTTIDIPQPPHGRATGRLALRILVDRRAPSRVKLQGGRWLAEALPAAIRVMPVICTYDRDESLTDVLARLGSDADALAAIAGIIVVNNGPADLPDRLAAEDLPAGLNAKLHVIEQDNVGGAGGFTRGMLEAKDLGASHVILMDDDVILEPEAVLRTARLYALARQDMVIAGHMLDLFRPTHLYEAGARLDDGKLSITPLHQGVELSQPGSLDRFLDDAPMHYNGWWFMGLPLHLLETLGWPMPCFIRGDDVEFGRRLHDAGIPLVATAGVGIWHEPFYAKLGSWHIYYELRNMFVLAARHLHNPSRRISMTALKWIVAELLMFRYQRAALQIRAVQDFMDGPGIYQADPGLVHASLGELRRRYPVETVRREQVLDRPCPPVEPRNRIAFVWRLLGALNGEWRRPDTGTQVIAVEPRDHIWFRARGADAIVVREAWEIEQPLYRRSRVAFRRLLGDTIRLAWRMRDMPDVVAEWRLAHAEFTSEAAWRAYLRMDAPAASSFATGMLSKASRAASSEALAVDAD